MSGAPASETVRSTRSLLDIPDDIWLEHLFPHMLDSVNDLLALRATHSKFKHLTDLESLWRQLIEEKYGLPSLTSTARAATSKSWRLLFLGLSRAKAYVWGEASQSRLALEAMQLHPQVRTALHRNRNSLPFPLPLDLTAPGTIYQPPEPWRPDGYTLSAEDAEEQEARKRIGAPVALCASGFGFQTLTSEGKVVAWGQLHEHDGWSVREVPSVLELPSSVKVKSLSAGRQHVVGLVKESIKEDGPPSRQETKAFEAFSYVGDNAHILEDAAGYFSDEREEKAYLRRADQDEQSDVRMGRIHSRDARRFTRLSREILQIEGGWSFSASLVSIRAHEAEGAGSTRSREVGREVWMWTREWGHSIAAEALADQATEIGAFVLHDDQSPPAGEATGSEGAAFAIDVTRPFSRLRRRCSPLRLPPLNEEHRLVSSDLSRPASDLKTPFHACETIEKIACGDGFTIALTNRASVYILDTSLPETDPLAGLVHGRMRGDDYARLAANRRAAAQCFDFDIPLDEIEAGEPEGQPRHQPRQWHRLAEFCEPRLIAQQLSKRGLDGLLPNESADKQGGSSASAEDGTENPHRITHITAHYKSFAVYNVPEAKDEETDGPDRAGFVLIGNANSDGRGLENLVPQIVPELQGRRVIKVTFGDWHQGALTDDGQVLTWGSWSQGALGLGGQVDASQSSPQGQLGHQPLEAYLPRQVSGVRPSRSSLFNVPRAVRIPAQSKSKVLFDLDPPFDANGNAMLLMRNQLEAHSRGVPRDPAPPRLPSHISKAEQAALASRLRETNQTIYNRLAIRPHPSKVEQPTPVSFALGGSDDAEKGKVLVYDIAFAGEHAGGLLE